MDQKEYKESDDGEVIYGVIIIFCKKDGESIQYLVVKNKETGNVSFVSGAQEHEDKDLIDTVHREVREELGISPDQYVVKPTTIDQKFIFGSKKNERMGKRGIYKVFWTDGSKLGSIIPTKELTAVQWMAKKDVLISLTFDDLKEVFEKASQEITL